MNVRPIATPEEHAKALREIDALWGSAPETEAGERLDLLATLVEHYEDRAFPAAGSDPVETIRVHMDLTGRTQRDLAELLGSASRASELLNRRRTLTIDMAHRLNARWGIPADLLIQPYELDIVRKRLA